MKYRKNNHGHCPYCGCDHSGLTECEHTMTTVTEDPRRTIEECGTCGKYSAKNNINGYQYPLIDPTDPNSSPVA